MKYYPYSFIISNKNKLQFSRIEPDLISMKSRNLCGLLGYYRFDSLEFKAYMNY